MTRIFYQHQQIKQYIKACTNGPLTYLRTLKNASSFFYNNFIEQFRWWPIEWSEIAWHESHVFSHIQDPLERRHKGVREYIIVNDCANLLLTDKNFQNFIRYVPFLDEHTVSLVDSYGTWCYSIDWIPIYDDYDITVSLTEKLMRVYGQRLFPWNLSHARPASPAMLDLYDLIKKLWDAYPDRAVPSHTKSYLSRDIDLYQDVMSKFNPKGDTWHRCSWLRER